MVARRDFTGLPFGFGLGYTRWEISDVTAEPDSSGGGTVTASVTNTGSGSAELATAR